MGFLDQLWGDVRNSLPQAQEAIGKSLLAALGDQSSDPHATGLTNLITRLQQAGLGNIVQTWISKQQPNQPITPDQVRQGLGEDHLEQLGQKSGLPKSALLAELAEALPKLVDALTPNGQIPMPPQPPRGADPAQAPGEAESRPVNEATPAASSALGKIDPTEPTQSKASNPG
ncbi:MAG: DUF937 domain-containing protein [Acetobacteraceae bacterium]|nr:DUF937 domain-containing protein [Acetobacteraceae bacterium]